MWPALDRAHLSRPPARKPHHDPVRRLPARPGHGPSLPTGDPSPASTRPEAAKEAEEEGHHGPAYERYEECEPLLKQSFPAYKACLRY